MKTMHLAKGVELPLRAVTEKFAILGQSGSGKSYTAMKLAELMLEAGAQIIALDPVGVWWGLLSTESGKGAGFPVTVFGGEHAHLPLQPESANMVADVLVDRGISAVLDVSDLTTSETKRFVRDFAERFFQRKKKSKSPVHVLFEEAQTFAPQVPERDEGVMLNRVERLVKIGRNYGVGCTLISQQPQAIHKRVLNQAGTLIAHRTIGSHERKAIDAWVVDKVTTEESASLINRLPELGTGEAVLWSPSFLKLFVTTQIAKRTTFDSSKTPEFGAANVEPKVLAPVEVEQLREALSESVKKAEESDPAALQKRIRELEAQLRRGPAPTKVEVKTVEVPVVPEKDLKRFEVLRDRAEKSLERFSASVVAKVEQLKEEVTGVRAMANTIYASLKHTPPLPRAKPRSPVVFAPRPVELRAPHARTSGDINEPHVGKGERAILVAIAQHEDGVTREQLTVLTGYKRSSRDAYLQRLRAAGLVNESEDRVLASSDGIALLGSDFQPLPVGDALREHWMTRLPEGERRILGVLVDAFPRAVEREQLGEATGYKRSSRDAYLQRLKARRLVETNGGGVKASGMLFTATSWPAARSAP